MNLDVQELEPGSRLPLVVRPAESGPRWTDLVQDLRALVDEHLLQCGGLLFRGVPLDGAGDFRAFASSFGHSLLSYEFGSTPRSKVAEGVYTSTEYPAHQRIPLHNEQAYTREWPMKIWFFCETPSKEGGETPIADSRTIYRRIDPRIRERFERHGLMYVRNFGNGLDVPWQQVFNVEDHASVERYCRERGIACEWKDDGELRTREVCQAVAAHPRTGEMVWFNQAHLFHVSGLAPEVREALLDTVDEPDLPRNVYYGDGSPLEDAVLDEVRGVLDEAQRSFPWSAGDVLMLDNMLTAHGRSPFRGPRKVIVAMAEGRST